MLLLSFIYLSVLYSTNDSLVFKPWICFFYRQDLVPHLLLFFPPSPPRGQICLFPPPVKQLSTQLLLYIYIRKKVKSLSLVRFFVTPWTAAYQAPPSMGFSRQAYWSGLPFPSPGDLPDPGTEPRSPTLQADALTSEPLGNYVLIFNRTHNSQC